MSCPKLDKKLGYTVDTTYRMPSSVRRLRTLYGTWARDKNKPAENVCKRSRPAWSYSYPHKRARNIDNIQLHPRSYTASLEHTITRATDNLLLTLNYTHA